MSRIVPKLPRPRLFHDGAERCAEVLCRRLQGASERLHHAYVTPQGKVYMARASAPRPASVRDSDFIGTYTPGTPFSVIEGDLLERRTELVAQAA